MLKNCYSPDYGTAVVEFLPGSRRVRLAEELWFYDRDGKWWVASPGLISDGASIPKAFWWLIGSPFTGRYRRGALLHDAAYQAGGDKIDKMCADEMLYDAMRVDGVSRWRSAVMYWAVRVFGKMKARA